jgi:hypothetical protein
VETAIIPPIGLGSEDAVIGKKTDQHNDEDVYVCVCEKGKKLVYDKCHAPGILYYELIWSYWFVAAVVVVITKNIVRFLQMHVQSDV